MRLADLRGRPVVLYFYPKNGTPGCTQEACAFRDAAAAFASQDAVIVGISPDSPDSHDRFKAKHNLPFRLASDPDHAIAQAYGAWGEKSLFGRKYWGILRSTFVIGPDGRIAAAYGKVRVRGHAAEVLQNLS